MYDIAIIGAGPAGATLARLLDNRYRVLLVDRRLLADPPNDIGYRKCCGGLLAPDAQAMLSRLGLGLPKHVLVEPQLFVVRAIDIPRRSERYYQRFYINMDRERFDRWLVSMVPAHVGAAFGFRLKACERIEGGFRIELTAGGSERIERAKVVVGADGAFSQLRRRMLPNAPIAPAYFAVQEWVEAETPLPYFSAIFDPGITDYYGWTIPKGDHLLVGAAIPREADPAGMFALFKEKLLAHGFRFGQTSRREGAWLVRPNASRQLLLGAKGIALIGEAGGWISPSSAEGLSYAFRSALALAESLRTGLDGFEHRYARAMRPLSRNLFWKQWKARLLFHPWFRNAAMRSGVHSVAIVEPMRPADSPLGEMIGGKEP